jgi:zinc protease
MTDRDPGVDGGLAPSRTVLDNGVVVVAKESRKTPAVTMNLVIRAGSICDPAEQPGAMHLLATGVSRHLFSLACTSLAEDFDALLLLLADIVMAPSVPASELAIRKGEVITQIRQDADNPAVRAAEGLMALLYGSHHPYGRPYKGTVQSVEGTTCDELLGLHAERFAPAGLTVAIVGDVDVSKAADLTASAFGSWRPGFPAPIRLAEAPPSTTRRRIVLPMMNKAQADIAYGFTTVARADPDYHAFWLMNVVLGQYAMGGRLGDSIRERQGMAYYASSSFDPNVIQAPLLIQAGVSAANVDRAIQSIDEELLTLARGGITQKELSDARQYMIGSMPRTLETNVGIAEFLQTSEFFGLGLDYDLRLPGLLGTVTADQVRDLARRYLNPDRASVVIAGPYDHDIGSLGTLAV